MKFTVWSPEYLNISAENLIDVGSVVFEIWPGKVKSRGAFIQAGTLIQQNAVDYVLNSMLYQKRVIQNELREFADMYVNWMILTGNMCYNDPLYTNIHVLVRYENEPAD